MTEHTGRTHIPFEGKISEETRQHFRAAREEFHKSIEGMLPPGFAEHHAKARKEFLLAWRGMIDSALQRMDDPKKKG